VDLTEKKWVRRERGGDAVHAEVLGKKMNLSKEIAELLVARGLTEEHDARKFFKPSVSELHDPFSMADMERAAGRLSSALDNKEKILVYGDYDVDGTTAVAMMYQFLRKFSVDVEYYIPDRYTEGYGVSQQGVDYAITNGVAVMVTLDCGIRAVEKIVHASRSGVDVVVCDHHNPGDVLPDAYAVLDPKRNDCPYPFKELSGCGVGFKLIHAICLIRNLPLKENLFCFLDLLAVSIAADIVPVTGENRILTYFGIKKLQISPSEGLSALLDVAGLADQDRISVSDLVFKLSPRINAAGRIESGRRAVELLIADSVDFAKNIALEVDSYNEDRKGIDKQITEDALAMLVADGAVSSKKSTVVYREDWHKGVVGIVASRLIERCYKPTIVLTYSGGKVTGSARSVEGFDLYAALAQCDDLLLNWGGHKYAAGLSMEPNRLDLFIARFESVVAASITPEQEVPKVYVDSFIPLSSVNYSFYHQLRMFEPFGPGNMTPVFATEQVQDDGTSRVVGGDGAHLKVGVKDASVTVPVAGIAFNMANKLPELRQAPFSLCYTIDENTFRGRSSLQLIVRDIKTAESMIY